MFTAPLSPLRYVQQTTTPNQIILPVKMKKETQTTDQLYLARISHSPNFENVRKSFAFCQFFPFIRISFGACHFLFCFHSFSLSLFESAYNCIAKQTRIE